jgi:hypothetical protein
MKRAILLKITFINTAAVKHPARMNKIVRHCRYEFQIKWFKDDSAALIIRECQRMKRTKQLNLSIPNLKRNSGMHQTKWLYSNDSVLRNYVVDPPS